MWMILVKFACLIRLNCSHFETVVDCNQWSHLIAIKRHTHCNIVTGWTTWERSGWRRAPIRDNTTSRSRSATATPQSSPPLSSTSSPSRRTPSWAQDQWLYQVWWSFTWGRFDFEPHQWLISHEKQWIADVSFMWRRLGSVYTEHQRECCGVASDIALIKLLRSSNELSESPQKWVTTPIDQIWCRRWHSATPDELAFAVLMKR